MSRQGCPGKDPSVILPDIVKRPLLPFYKALCLALLVMGGMNILNMFSGIPSVGIVGDNVMPITTLASCLHETVPINNAYHG